MKVLVVDDDSVCLEAARSLLQEYYNCEVDTASTSEKTLNIIYEKGMNWEPEWYDFVLMDIEMPTIKGDLLTKIIRETEKRMLNVPIIAITSEINKGKVEEFKQKGVVDVIFKPLTKEKIDMVIAKYV